MSEAGVNIWLDNLDSEGWTYVLSTLCNMILSVCRSAAGLETDTQVFGIHMQRASFPAVNADQVCMTPEPSRIASCSLGAASELRLHRLRLGTPRQRSHPSQPPLHARPLPPVRQMFHDHLKAGVDKLGAMG